MTQRERAPLPPKELVSVPDDLQRLLDSMVAKVVTSETPASSQSNRRYARCPSTPSGSAAAPLEDVGRHLSELLGDVVSEALAVDRASGDRRQ